MKKFFLPLLVISLIIMPTLVYADTAADVKAALIKNMKATQNEDVDAMMATIHTQSPFYLITKQQMKPMFENFDFKYELIKYEFIGTSGEYALARVVLKSTKIAGPAFRNNEVDIIQVLKQENNVWKVYSQASLGIKFLN